MWFYFKITNRQATLFLYNLGVFKITTGYIWVFTSKQGSRGQCIVMDTVGLWRLSQLLFTSPANFITGRLFMASWLRLPSTHPRCHSLLFWCNHMFTILKELKCWKSSPWQLCSTRIIASQGASLPYKQ